MPDKIIIFFFIIFLFNCASEPNFADRKHEKKIEILNAEHIIFIGLDGFGSKYVPKANMPNFKRMINEGASSMNVYNILPPISYPNWSTLFTGIPYNKQKESNYPSILTIIKNADKDISFFYEWSDMKKISDKDNIDSVSIASDYESTVKFAKNIKKNKPVFSSIVYSEPDNTGHEKMYGSKQYYKKLEQLDDFISIIIQASMDAGIYNNTVFIISSDHGGLLFEHQVNLNSIRRIPLVFFGKGIKKGYTITSPSSICDIAPTIAIILGLDAPSEWTGIPLWEIFDLKRK